MKKSKLYLHVGAHKSASTTIQKNFIANSDFFKSIYGVSFWGGQALVNTPILSHFKKLSRGFLKDSEYHDSLLRAQSYVENDVLFNSAINFISWEGFLGHSGLDLYSGFYTHYKEVIHSLKEIFRAFDLQILLVARRQSDFIESCYLQQIKEGRALNFEDFLSPLNLDSSRWGYIANSFRSEFGDSFHFYPFESIKTLGTKRFLENISSLLFSFDISFDSCKILDKANSSYSKYGVDIANELLPKLSKKNKTIVNKILFRELSSEKYGKAKFFNEFETRLMGEYFISENKKLVANYFNTIPECYLSSTSKDGVEKYWLYQ